MRKIIKVTLPLFALLVIAVAGDNPEVDIINEKSAAKLLPEALMLSHCAKWGYGPKECKARDFIGAAADLDGNKSPEFAIAHNELNPQAEMRCTLYGDEKAKFKVIMNKFPCEIELLDGSTRGMRNLNGNIYPTDCEPLKCEFKWSGSAYKQGECIPIGKGCAVE